MNEEKKLNLGSVISRCKNCNEPIIFDKLLNKWRHHRPLAFFDNGNYCDNTKREANKYAEK